jgi:hypothetical protein
MPVCGTFSNSDSGSLWCSLVSRLAGCHSQLKGIKERPVTSDRIQAKVYQSVTLTLFCVWFQEIQLNQWDGNFNIIVSSSNRI